MLTLTEKVWKLKPPHGLFDETVVQNLFPDISPGALRALVHRAVRKGEIIALKPGHYCLSPEFNDFPPHPFVIAGMLHAPSYISMESALWYHQLIPEALFGVSSVTAKRNRIYKTPMGVYSFFRIPCNYLKSGVRAEKIDGNDWAFVAAPLRAIADMIYRYRETTWEKEGLRFLTDSLRIEKEDLENISLEDFADVYNSFRNKRVREFLMGLKGEIGR
jgi:predicted transcriptional regulator of viral defense system